MRITHHPHPRQPLGHRRESGMTLVEIMIASTLMLMVFAGLFAAHFLGLREDQLMESKAGASDSSRYAINQFLQDIRSSKGYDIGSSWNGTTFIPITNGYFQGPNLRLYTSIIATNQIINTNTYIVYYFDSSQAAAGNGMLYRYGPGSNGVATTSLVTSNLINTLWFTSENYLGATQTSRTYKGVVHTTLQFTQFLYPLTQVGSNCLYTYYRIDCRATPHLPDGP